jgi:hypothetical protein
MYQRTLEQQLMEEQAKVNEELYLKVTDYLKGYAARERTSGSIEVQYQQRFVVWRFSHRCYTGCN